MLPTMLLLSVASFDPPQDGLQLTNDRITFGGQFGPTRADNRFLPGDLFYLVFDIEGLHADAQGKVTYSMGMTLTDAAGKLLFESKPAEQSTTLPLGASKLPAKAWLFLGLDLKGTLTCKITVAETSKGSSQSLERKLEVVAPDFGIIGFNTTYDKAGMVAAPLSGVPGQSLWVHFDIVGFHREPKDKQPHVQVELRVFDRATQKSPTEQPLAYEVKSGVKDDEQAVSWDIPLPLNRAGQFTIEFRATDRISGKVSKITFPLNVPAK